MCVCLTLAVSLYSKYFFFKQNTELFLDSFFQSRAFHLLLLTACKTPTHQTVVINLNNRTAGVYKEKNNRVTGCMGALPLLTPRTSCLFIINTTILISVCVL